MGTVWAARHELLGRDFALKFAIVPSKADSATRARFQREAQLVGKLRHPNIVDVTDFGEVSPDGDFFLAMELLEGESLAARITQQGKLDSYEAVSIAADVARGLTAVHAVGIVHRDIKPENIFLARSPTGSIVPKLLDFGISKEWGDSLTTQQGALTGTPAYMSPEQANGETKLDPRTDIWSLGVVLYEMLTGKHPFVEPNYQALMTAIAERPHVPLEATVPTALCRIIDACLAKHPDDRFSTSEELTEALQSFVAGATVNAPSTRTRARRSSYMLIVGSGVASLLIAVITLWLLKPGTGAEPHLAPTPSVATEIAVHASSTPLTVPVANPTTSSVNIAITAPPKASLGPQATSRSTQPSRDKRPSTSVTTPGF
jgi:eukaryotic-like serine/threonine-protein kinase